MDVTPRQMAVLVRDVAERHYAPATRHIGREDYDLLIAAAEMLQGGQTEE